MAKSGSSKNAWNEEKFASNIKLQKKLIERKDGKKQKMKKENLTV
jgi:hypothetical protein